MLWATPEEPYLARSHNTSSDCGKLIRWILVGATDDAKPDTSKATIISRRGALSQGETML